MDGSIIVLVVTTIVGWLGAALGWFKWLHELREKRLEKAAKEKAEAELALINLRGNAPFFILGDIQFTFFHLGDIYAHSGWPNVLCWCRHEVVGKLPPDELIYVVLQNVGKHYRSCVVESDLETGPIAIHPKSDVKSVPELYLLTYRLDPAHHGRTQILTMTFEVENGTHGIHRYEMKHGQRHLLRLNPALPVASGKT